MPDVETPGQVADRMVELLFEDGDPLIGDRLLYPAGGDGELIAAVRRYIEDAAMTRRPEEVAVEPNQHKGEMLESRYPELDVKQVDFLDTELRLGDEFDFVLCNPPVIRWETKDEEYRKDRAADFGFVSATDTNVNEDMLFLEQSLRYLAEDGRAVFFTSPDFKTVEPAAGLRNRLLYRVEGVEDVCPGDYPQLNERRVLTTISDEDTNTAPIRYEPDEFEALLGQRTDSDRPFDVSEIMTSDPAGYSPDTSIADAYIDMLYEDFDAAPVYRDLSTESEPIGYVSRRDLRADADRTVGEVAQPFGDLIVTPDTHLSTGIDILDEERFFFVGTSRDVQGIVTRFDLNRLPVFINLYDRLSEVEIGLRKLIRQEEPDWDQRASPQVHSTTNSEIRVDRLSDAKFSDLQDIVEDLSLESEILRDIHGYDVTLEDITDLRGNVAHYNPIVHTMKDESTLDDARSAPQLAAEYRFIRDCIRGLPVAHN